MGTGIAALPGIDDPILDGELAAAARDAIRAIADQIMVVPSARDRPEHLALFWAYASAELDDRRDRAHRDAAIAALIERACMRDHGIELFGGVAGAGWVLAHVADDVEDLLAPIDAFVVEQLAYWTGAYDLIGGLVGLGMYLLDRAAIGSARARAGLGCVVERLEQQAERSDAGTTWHTPHALVPPTLRAEFPRGYYDCGVAHGVPGVIGFLARVVAERDAPRTAELCRDAMRWLRASAIGCESRAGFPVRVVPGAPRVPTRNAWCYGDAGVAAAMWRATSLIGAPADDWLELAVESATREPTRSGVVDAGLCHGALGLAHIYHRLYRATRRSVFRDASRGWFARGLAMREPGRGIGGFDVDGHDLLGGAAGIGLALLGGLSSETTGWDRLILLDLS